LITFNDIQDAYRTVAPIVHHTPLLTSSTFDRHCGNAVSLKAENLQRIGAFKIRGAYNKIFSLTPDERMRGIIAHSSGNHAQGVALASSLLGVKATVVMPRSSPAIKLNATRGYGAEVVLCEDSSDDRERVAKEYEEHHNLVPVPPFNDDKIIAGQGTATLEIGEDLRDLDYLFVPIGGGGLIGGSAVAAKHLWPNVKVIGVETAPANDAQQSFRRGAIVRIPPPNTIADGMRTQAVGSRTFEIIQKYVDDIVTVTDAQVVEMMRFLLFRMKILTEPTGAVAPAAIFHNVLGLKGKRACAIISGGNIEPAMLQKVISEGLD
jgi:threonine ammonia-lyase medium form